MIKPVAKEHPIYKHLVAKINAKAADSLRRDLVAAAEHGAKIQLRLALTAQKAADDLRGGNSIPSLADEIISQQDHKIERYGDKAFCLSEKQIEVIVRDIID